MKLKQTLFWGSLLALSLTACGESNKSEDSPKVQIVGSLKESIWKNMLRANVSIDTLNHKNLYGIGVQEGLRGDVVTFDGVDYSIISENGVIKVSENKTLKSPYYVYQTVPSWIKVSMDQPISNLYELGNFVLSRKELKKNRETAVKIEGKFNGLEIAVHALPEKLSQYSYAIALNTVHRAQLSDVEGTIVGFFDAERTMKFTHHGEMLNLYFISKDKKTMGRVMQLFYDKEDIQVYLPKY